MSAILFLTELIALQQIEGADDRVLVNAEAFIDAQEKGLARIKQLAKSTFTPGVLTEIGSFGGLFRPELTGMAEPVPVASADGVGTKLMVAKMAGDSWVKETEPSWYSSWSGRVCPQGGRHGD